jgi:uncharacterized protein (PEP-CTERM system associated)
MLDRSPRASATRRLRLGTGGVALAGLALLVSSAPHAETWRIVPMLSYESTFTNNVELTSDRRSDWVNQFTPGIQFTELGAHSRLNGRISLPMLLYARTHGSNDVAPQANVVGTFEAIEKFFFIDASANVAQQFRSPLGARSVSLANATGNRYTQQTYTISPYIDVQRPDGLSYGLRQQSIWSNAGGSGGVLGAGTGGNSFTSNVIGRVTRQVGVSGFSLDYNRSDIRFSDTGNLGEDKESTELVRLSALYRPDPTLQLSASFGYENNQFFFSEERGTTYGAGINWHPTDRTNLDATWEHRFFGPSYHVTFNHRMPLTVLTLAASRDLTTYPQQVAALPEGGDVNTLLNSIFSSRVSDPILRQSLVDQVIRERGLPNQLSTPLAIYAQQITLAESFSATFGILGARNTIFFRAYHLRNEPAVRNEEALATLLTLLATKQTGGNVTWTHQLASDLALTATADASRASDASNLSTRFHALNVTLSHNLSPLTLVYGGARYQHSASNTALDVAANFSELAVFFGLTHSFR